MRQLQQQRDHHHPRPTVVAILGTHTLSEDILGQLLEREGYSVRHLETSPTGLPDEPLDGVDVLLLAPSQKDGVSEGFLEAMSSTQEPASIPVLPLSSALKLSLLDELAADAPWRTLFEELVGQIGAALQRAAESARALVVEGAEPPPSPAPQADAL